MKKLYGRPEIEITIFSPNSKIMTETATGNLGGGDDYGAELSEVESTEYGTDGPAIPGGE